MKINILEGTPSNCADGVLTASKHLSGSEMGKATNTVPSEYTETAVELSKKATPKDCINCIGQYCMLKVEDGKVNGDRLQATHSKLIQNSPRKRPEVAYQKLEEQSGYFEYRDIKEKEVREREAKEAKELPIAAERNLKRVIDEEKNRGVSEEAIEDVYKQDLPLAS